MAIKPKRPKSGLKPSQEREVRSLYTNWEQNITDAEYYEKRADAFELELGKHNVDPRNPPDWILQE